MVVKVMAGFIGLATLSIGFVTAAYYVLPSLSRYVARLFSSREAKKLPPPPATPIISQTHSTERTPNGITADVRSYFKSDLNRNGQNLTLGAGIEFTPEDFKQFIGYNVIMTFEKQRLVKFQFFVVLLASEDDLRDLTNMTFHPHKSLSPRQPLLNNQELTMPSANHYGNYIVARFESCQYHSEEVVFGPKYDNPFSQLWSAYVHENGRRPKAIIMYSWNFPCGRCTDLIVDILGEQQYSVLDDVRVLIAYSRVWDSEEGYPRVVERNMEKMRDRIGAYIQDVEPPVPLQEAGES
jgi:hypothetical protein